MIQSLSNASQHVPIYLQPFPGNSTRKFKSKHIVCTFWPPLGTPPGTIAVNLHGKENSMLVKRIAACPSIFNRLRAIARYWSEIAAFSYTFAFNAPVGGVPIGIPGKRLVFIKLESWGYQGVKKV